MMTLLSGSDLHFEPLMNQFASKVQLFLKIFIFTFERQQIIRDCRPCFDLILRGHLGAMIS